MKSGERRVVRKQNGKRPSKARESHPSLAQPPPVPREESEPNWRIDEDAEVLLLALFGGKPWRYTPFEEIAKDCPAVWKCALEFFGGDRVAARKWLETRSPAFQGKCPYTVALQVHGEQKVLCDLKRLARARPRHARRPNKRRRK